MAAKIYAVQGGFPKKSSKLRELIVAELSSSGEKIRFTTGYFNTGSDVRDTLGSYVETKPLSYGHALTSVFYQFIMEADVIPEGYRRIRVVSEQDNGQWLLSLQKW